ncbi:MAG: helix-turn-helix transcriptional regulator [Bacteroidales bacterium]
MKDRILQIMEHEGLTPAKFAEVVDIQRASLSHITTGRNQPSLQVVAKILEKYPNINPDWLLFGKGNMMRNGITSATEPDMFAQAPTFAGKSREIETGKPQNTVKDVTKIMIFYSDNTYDMLVPDNTK